MNHNQRLKLIHQSHFKEQSRDGAFDILTFIVGNVSDRVDVLHDGCQFDPDLFILYNFVGRIIFLLLQLHVFEYLELLLWASNVEPVSSEDGVSLLKGTKFAGGQL